MIRVKNPKTKKNRHKKIIKLAKGYYGKANVFRIAKERVEHALENTTRDRHIKRRRLRSLWIVRINSFCRQYLDINYKEFINNFTLLNRKNTCKLLNDNPEALKFLYNNSTVK